MAKIITNTVRDFIIRNAEGHRDSITNEINCTTLAEQTADKFNLYEDQDYTIPEEVFEEALKISERMG